jgi:hypothetical protein
MYSSLLLVVGSSASSNATSVIQSWQQRILPSATGCSQAHVAARIALDLFGNAQGPTRNCALQLLDP